MQSQKMDAVGRLAGGIAHDLNNLLTAILGCGELLSGRLEPESREAGLVRPIVEAGERARDLVRQLLAFSRKESLNPDFISIGELCRDLLRLLRHVIGEHISLELNAPKGLDLVYADRSQVEQVVMNLCVNARDAMPSGGSLRVSVYQERRSDPSTEKQSADFVVIEVKDSGKGMEPEAVERAFEPFFTTKERGGGTGLGLATVYAVVERHQGVVTIDSEPGVGTTVRVYLPASGLKDAKKPPHESAVESLTGTETVLLAEDDDLVRKLAVSVLESAGYHVIAANTGWQAVDLFGMFAEQIDLLVLDVLMPGISGRDAYEAIRERKPDIPVLFCSGYSAQLLESDHLLRIPTGKLLSKPYSPRELLRNVRRLLDQGDTVPDVGDVSRQASEDSV